jgi:hypothetical protein
VAVVRILVVLVAQAVVVLALLVVTVCQEQ